MKQYMLMSLLWLGAVANVHGVDTENQNGKVFEDMSLSVAASIGDIATLERLIKTGVNVNEKDNWGYKETPLHHAVHNTVNYEKTDEESYELARLLLGAGADVKARNNRGETPLHIAIKWCYEKATDLLIKAGADIHVKDNEGNTPLHHATYLRGHDLIVEMLLKAGTDADINAANNEGTMPLHLAVNCYNYYSFDEKVIEMLLKAGADVTAKDSYGRTPIDIAQSSSPYELQKKVIIGKLVALAPQTSVAGVTGLHEKKCNSYQQCFPLHVAARAGNVSEMKRLIVSGADVNKKDKHGNIPLHWAATMGNIEIAQLLIDAGANVNIQNSEKSTPLHNAAFWGYEQFVRLLLRAGADITLKNSVGYTALDEARMMRGNENVVALIKNGDNSLDDSNVVAVVEKTVFEHPTMQWLMEHQFIATTIFSIMALVLIDKLRICLYSNRLGFNRRINAPVQHLVMAFMDPSNPDYILIRNVIKW